MIKLPKPVNQSLAADIAALDCRYRGSPSYEHEAAYMRKAAENLVLKGYSIYTESQLKQAVRDAIEMCARASDCRDLPATSAAIRALIKEIDVCEK